MGTNNPEEMSLEELRREIDGFEKKQVCFWTEEQRCYYLRRLIRAAERLDAFNEIPRIEGHLNHPEHRV